MPKSQVINYYTILLSGGPSTQYDSNSLSFVESSTALPTSKLLCFLPSLVHTLNMDRPFLFFFSLRCQCLCLWFLYYAFYTMFVYLALGMWDLQLEHKNSQLRHSSLTRDRTQTPCTGSSASQSPDHQGSYAILCLSHRMSLTVTMLCSVVSDSL